MQSYARKIFEKHKTFLKRLKNNRGELCSTNSKNQDCHPNFRICFNRVEFSNSIVNSPQAFQMVIWKNEVFLCFVHHLISNGGVRRIWPLKNIWKSELGILHYCTPFDIFFLMIKLDSLPFWFELNLWHMKQKHDQNPTTGWWFRDSKVLCLELR